MKKLNELITCEYDTIIKGVVSDTREVESGFLFVAIKGFFVDRFDYLDKALENGAAAVIVDRKPSFEVDVPVIIVENVNQVYLDVLGKFHNNVEKDFSFIGITGTDGKTTVAMMLWQLLDNFIPSAYMGTNGLYYQDTIRKLSNTTPEPAAMYKELDLLHEKQCQCVIMEAASEALLHGRCDALEMKYAILTNITEDHLDIHKTMENYVAAKKKLFHLVKEDGCSIVNMDDVNYNTIIEGLTTKVYSYGMNEEADFTIKNVIRKEEVTTFDIEFLGYKYSIESPYFGLYNVYNLTSAIAVLLLEGYPFDLIKELVKKLSPIPGRGEALDFDQDYTLILDYAHTENGVETILKEINQNSYDRVITVIGSAGGRQKDKRSKMGKYALDYSDLVIFTMDDPRHENVDDIIDDLISGTNKDNYLRINDRKDAIHHALSLAKKGDVVMVLGKGRDSYMAIGSERIDYSDYDTIKEYFD